MVRRYVDSQRELCGESVRYVESEGYVGNEQVCGEWK